MLAKRFKAGVVSCVEVLAANRLKDLAGGAVLGVVLGRADVFELGVDGGSPPRAFLKEDSD